MATLQQQVQQHLQNTGISLRELSRRSGVSHTTIGKILRGGEYLSDTANDLIFAMGFYGGDTARPVMQDKAVETLDAAVEQLAAQCVNADLTHHADWDTDLQCAKYRRVMQLEQQLNDANTAYLSSKSQHERDVQRLNDAQDKLEYMKLLAGEDGRKLQDYQAQIGKAEAMILGLNDSNECLQRQLDQGRAQFKSLHDAYNQQVDDGREMLAQIDTLFVERENAATKHDQRVMRLRVYFLIVSGLVVWGGV